MTWFARARSRIVAGIGLLTAVSPNAATALELCGEKIVDLPTYIATLTAPGLSRLSESDKYISVKGTQGKTWTVTKPANPAHPAIVCREMKEQNGAVVVKSNASCAASQSACEAMMAEFKQLDVELRKNVENAKKKSGAAAPAPVTPPQ